jgi:hypothetical protein
MAGQIAKSAVKKGSFRSARRRKKAESGWRGQIFQRSPVIISVNMVLLLNMGFSFSPVESVAFFRAL